MKKIFLFVILFSAANVWAADKKSGVEWKNTTLSEKKRSDHVNIELDLLAKYLARQTKKTDLKALLEKYDYIK